MNIVFWLGVIGVCVLIWFLCSFAFKGIGKVAYRLYDDAMEEIKDPKIETKENENEQR